MTKKSRGATAHDVAKRAGVSQATVSYVVSGRRNGHLRISEETQQRVLGAVAELNYVPNDAARSLRRRRTQRVCLVVQRLGVPFDDELARDIRRVADQHNYTLIVALGGEPVRERQVLDQLQRGLADGAVLITNTMLAADLVPLVDTGLALVVLNNMLVGSGFDAIRTNEAEACFEAVSYLIDCGHRRIAFLGHTLDRSPQNERLESYIRAFEERGIPIDQRLLYAGASTRQQAHQATRALIELADRPTALFATADIAAISAILAAQGAGLRVPDDLAVVGVGNIPESELISPALTTVGPTTLDFSAIADLLFSRLEAVAPLESRDLTMMWRLILRESC
jgi:DNA-binding LacI/PurR family transcriptional regulator